MPAWYLLVGALTVFAVLGVLWPRLLYSLPLLAIVLGVPLGQAALRANAAVFSSEPLSRITRLKCQFTTALLHLLQPIARLYGRFSHGLTRWRGHPQLGLLWPRTISLWHETWRGHIDHLSLLETALCDAALFVKPGSTRERWDLEVRGGLFGKVRTRMTVVDPESDKPMIRFRAWPMGSSYSLALSLLFALLGVGAILDQAYVPAVVLGGVALTITYRMLQESTWAMSGLLEGLKRLGARD